jgi:hypothetical protein
MFGPSKLKSSADFRNNLSQGQANYNSSLFGNGIIDYSKSRQGVVGFNPRNYSNFAYSRPGKNKHQTYQREQAAAVLNPQAPLVLYDDRILPQNFAGYIGPDLNPNNQLVVDSAGIYTYDKLATTPWNKLTTKQKKERLQKFGTNGTPYKSVKEGLKTLSGVTSKPVPPKEPELERIPMREATRLPVTQPQLEPINLNLSKSPKQREFTSYQSNQTQRTGQVAQGKYYYDNELKKWQYRPAEQEEIDYQLDKGRIKQLGGGIYLGDYEFKDGGLVKYQNRGEVDNTNQYINTNLYNHLYENQELARKQKNWDAQEEKVSNSGEKVSKYKGEFPLTYSLAEGLRNVPRYSNSAPDDFFDLLNRIAITESRDKNIEQVRGPGRGYYQFEPPSAITAKNRAAQIQKDLKDLGYDLTLPQNFDTNFMNLSKDEQAFYALSNLIKVASAKRGNNPNYKIDFSNPGKAWFDLHWAGSLEHPEAIPERIEHWNSRNPDLKIALDKDGNVVVVKKQGGLVKAQKGLNKRMVRQYPGMKSVYGDRGENLNVIKDKNFIPSEYGYGDIEFIYPGSGLVTYNDEYAYQSPTPDKYTAVYNPKGANKHDVFLDMMHGMRHDPDYMELLNEFSQATRNARGADMDYFFDQDAQQDPNFVIDGREQWDNNYIDGMVRAHMYKKASQQKRLPFVNPFGSKPHGTEDYEMELEPNSPEMYQAADQIYNYIKGDKNRSLKKVKIKSLPRNTQ